MQTKIAFDLDETLGTIITDGNSIIGFNIRSGCIELLTELKTKYCLALWTVSNRSYVEKVLNYGLRQFFDEIYTWDEISDNWKDIRKINASYLIDDSEFYREKAKQYGLESKYIIIPGYGSNEDIENDMLWVTKIKQIITLL